MKKPLDDRGQIPKDIINKAVEYCSSSENLGILTENLKVNESDVSRVLGQMAKNHANYLDGLLNDPNMSREQSLSWAEGGFLKFALIALYMADQSYKIKPSELQTYIQQP